MTQNPDRKIYKTGQEAQEKLERGLDIGADIVGKTLGSAGHNVLIERKNRTPIITNDGLTVINQLILEDELENLGVTSLVDAANHASDTVGDGTSTTMVLVNVIYKAGKKIVGDGNAFALSQKSPMEVRGEIEEAKRLVLDELKKLKKEVKTKEEIRSVAFSACENGEMADTIADLVEKVGENGIIIVEEGGGSAKALPSPTIFLPAL